MANPNGEKYEEVETCKYKGVRKRKWGKWVSEIRLPNSRERIWLGSYDSPEKAARAFDAALFCLRGATAKFNFPDSPPEIPGGRSLSPPEIQLAAARFANSFCQGDILRQTQLAEESPCGSSFVVLDGPGQLDSELTSTGSVLELLTTMGSGNFAADYGIFPGFDELNNGFIAPIPPDNVAGGVDCFYGEENLEGVLGQDSFLWNFSN